MINTDSKTKGFLLHFHTFVKKINPKWDKEPELFVLIKREAYFFDKSDLKKCLAKWNQCENWGYCLTEMDVKANELTKMVRIPKNHFIHHGEQGFGTPTIGEISKSPINVFRK